MFIQRFLEIFSECSNNMKTFNLNYFFLELRNLKWARGKKRQIMIILTFNSQPVLICLIFGVITSYEICKVNYMSFFKYDFIVNKV